MELSEKVQIVGTWVYDLSRALNVELSLNDEGTCTFQFGTEIVVAMEISKDFPIVHLYSPLVAIPVEEAAAVLLMARALELNAFQTFTRGGAIAAIRGESLLVFCYNFPIAGGDAEIFSQVLGSFIETVPELKAMLQTNEAKSQGLPQESSRSQPFFMLKA